MSSRKLLIIASAMPQKPLQRSWPRFTLRTIVIVATLLPGMTQRLDFDLPRVPLARRWWWWVIWAGVAGFGAMVLRHFLRPQSQPDPTGIRGTFNQVIPYNPR